MKRQLTKNEILARMREVKKISDSSDKSPFTGMATVCNYTLWKNEGWSQKKLADYNMAVAEYDKKLDSGEVTIEQLQERLWNKADFSVEYVKYTYRDIKSRKNSFMYELEKKINEANNTINELAARYFLMHFNTLMDMGYGKKRLERNKDQINNLLNVITSDEKDKSKPRIMDLHKELYEEAGIYIEMPNIA